MTTPRNFNVKASSIIPMEASVEVLTAVMLELGNTDYESVLISVTARPRGYAESKRRRAAARRDTRRQLVLRRARAAIAAKAKELGIPEFMVAAELSAGHSDFKVNLQQQVLPGTRWVPRYLRDPQLPNDE